MASGYKWKPLARAVAKPPSEELIRRTMEITGRDRDGALEYMAKEEASCELWANDLYQVQLRVAVMMVGDEAQPWAHLNIRRLDGYPGRDWRHFQQIKNELLGPECEAVELYPAESRLVDTSNKYHLWGCKQPGFRFPIGFQKRDVEYHGTHTHTPGLRQNPAMQFAKGESDG